MTASNRVQKIAIVGASGTSGAHISNTLLEAGTFSLTAITRPDSTSVFPSAFQVARVDYDDHDELVNVLRGQDVLIITLSIPSAFQQPKLIRAAADAGVPYIFPNEWSYDTAADSSASKAYIEDIPVRPMKSEDTHLIRSLGKSAYISMVVGPWYEWSLHLGPETFGFDLAMKEVTFYDDGETKVPASTFPQIGRAVAALLSLPIRPESDSDSAAGKFLENYANKHVYISSFIVSQKDIFRSILRATGDAEDAWTIKHESATKRHSEGFEQVKIGADIGGNAFVKTLYARIFRKDSFGSFQQTRGLDNGALGLQEEDLDAITARSFETSKA